MRFAPLYPIYLANIIPQKQRESNRFRLLSPICTKDYFTQVSVLFAEFARCAIEKRNIVLKTKGETERCYLDISDAVSAILTVLLNGKIGEIYTAANEETYCSIYEMAKLVAEMNGIDVEIKEQDI